MYPLNTTLNTKAVAANADTGRVAVSATSGFRLTTTLDNSKTVRRNAVVGDVSVAHTNSKEFGAGTGRHLVRVDLRQNGELPPASAYLVITAPDSPAGSIRGIEAFWLLMNALISLSGDVLAADLGVQGSNGVPALEADSNAVNPGLDAFVSGFVGSEG
jgi:hypothetical protein